MSKRIAVMALGILLLFSIVLLVYEWFSMNELKLNLQSKAIALAQAETQLQQTKVQLQQTGDTLTQTKTQLTKTEGELTQTKSQLTSRETELTQVKVELETAKKDKFFFYYVKPEQQYGASNLALYLASWRWKKTYQINVFDCSEMSAALEWELENNGFHTKIVVGKSPDGSGVKHAWLLVETASGTYMPVEATQMAVVYASNPYFNNYFKSERQFETIQEALVYYPNEFDWWSQ